MAAITSATPGRRRRRPSITALGAGLLLAGLLAAAAPPLPAAAQGIHDWITALRPVAAAADAGNDAGGGEDSTRPAPIALLGFEAAAVAMTAAAKARLDALASALMSEALAPYVFEIRWYADPKKAGAADQALSERRAASMYAYLQTRRGIMPTRVMLRWARRKPHELAEDVPADTVVIKVVNLGQQ